MTSRGIRIVHVQVGDIERAREEYPDRNKINGRDTRHFWSEAPLNEKERMKSRRLFI